MKRLTIFSLMLCACTILFAQYNKENLKIIYAGQSGIAEYGNLKIYPIRANQVFKDAHQSVGEYVPLKEALESKKLKITEQEDGGTVNTLFIENKSQDTLFLMAGEVVKGGKQDRVLAQDMVVPPKSGKQDISVFCVERGRWSYGGGKEFGSASNVTSKNVQKAVVTEKNQSKVWEEVGNTTSANDASTSTGTYSALESSKEFTGKLKSYLEHYNAIPYKGNDIIGIIGVTGDKVIGCDLFATPDLFNSHFEGLIQSYATEAISNGTEVTINDTKVQDYLDEILVSDEEEQESVVRSKGMLYKRGDKKLHFSTF